MGGMDTFADAVEALCTSFKKMNPFCIPFAIQNMGALPCFCALLNSCAEPRRLTQVVPWHRMLCRAVPLHVLLAMPHGWLPWRHGEQCRAPPCSFCACLVHFMACRGMAWHAT